MDYMCLKPVVDTREQANVIRSRIGIERDCHWIYQNTNLYEFARELYRKDKRLVDWYLIDEAQFLTTAQVDQLRTYRR